jgi:hypothetical protein
MQTELGVFPDWVIQALVERLDTAVHNAADRLFTAYIDQRPNLPEALVILEECDLARKSHEMAKWPAYGSTTENMLPDANIATNQMDSFEVEKSSTQGNSIPNTQISELSSLELTVPEIQYVNQSTSNHEPATSTMAPEAFNFDEYQPFSFPFSDGDPKDSEVGFSQVLSSLGLLGPSQTDPDFLTFSYPVG